MASSSPIDLKEKGNRAFKAGRFREAVSYFSEAIAVDPNNAVLFSNRSAALASLHRYEEALADGQAAVSLKPDWAKAYGRVATACFALESWDDAVVAYMQGLELDPYNANLRNGLRDALAHSKGNPTEAPWVPHTHAPPAAAPHAPQAQPYPMPSAQAFFPSKQPPQHAYGAPAPMQHAPMGPAPAEGAMPVPPRAAQPHPAPRVAQGAPQGPPGSGPVGPVPAWNPMGSSLIFTADPIHMWNAEHVAAFLQQLELPSLIPVFKENGVNGRDLLLLSDNDFVHDLGVTRLQLRKLRTGIAELRLALPHITAGPMPAQKAPPRKGPVDNGSWFDMYVAGNPYVHQFSKRRPSTGVPQEPVEPESGPWGPAGPSGPSGSSYSPAPEGPSIPEQHPGMPPEAPAVPDPADSPSKAAAAAETTRHSPSFDTSYSFKPTEQFKLRPTMPPQSMGPSAGPTPQPRPTTESPLAEGRWAPPPNMHPDAPAPPPAYNYGPPPPQHAPPHMTPPTGAPHMGPEGPRGYPGPQGPAEDDMAGGGPARGEGVYQDGVAFQNAPTSDGYYDERAYMRVAPPPPGYDAYGRPLNGPLNGYYVQGGTHIKIPSIDGMHERNSPRRGSVVFRELPAMVQPPPVVKVHPQLKAEANWVQRLIQNLLAPRMWEGHDGAPKEMNTQRHIVKLKTAMAQAVAVGFFELNQRGTGVNAWTQSRGFVLSNLGWREGQPVWTAPCFYEIKAGIDRSVVQQGLQEIACCLVINSPEALKKMARGRPVLGIDIPLKPGFADGPMAAADSDIADPKVADLVVFSVRRGQALELNLAGGRIIGTEDNYTYFGRGVTPERILSGKVPQPEEFLSAYKTITSLTVGGATLLSFMQNQQQGNMAMGGMMGL